MLLYIAFKLKFRGQCIVSTFQYILFFMVPCIIILNLIKTNLMHSSSVLLHLNPLYMFRIQLASILRSINMYIQVHLYVHIDASSSVLLHLNPLYMFRMQLESFLRSINMYIQVVQDSSL